MTYTATVSVYHQVMLYGMLAEAWGCYEHCQSTIPDGVMLDAPEQGRQTLDKGSSYRFGVTCIAPSHGTAQQRIISLAKAVAAYGPKQLPANSSQRLVLGGNFHFKQCVDTFTNQPLEKDQTPALLTRSMIRKQAQALADASRVCLDLYSPLRMQRPQKHRQPHHGYFDDHYFDFPLWCRRLLGRIKELRLWVDSDGQLENSLCADAEQCQVTDKQLAWVDLAYRNQNKSLGGVIGKVFINFPTTLSEAARQNMALILTLGQYIHNGKNTRFGFGAYQALPQRDDASLLNQSADSTSFYARPSSRSQSLLALAFTCSTLDEQAVALELEAGHLRATANRVVAGDYQPQRAYAVTFTQGSKQRTLHIPQPLDMALQRTLTRYLTPIIDQTLSNASHGYRRGRHTAAKCIEDAYAKGYRFAIRADFERFFENIPLDLLQTRLHATLNDPLTEQAIMAWVSDDGDANNQRGIPLGSPLSPMLANLFLDRFDDWITEAGGTLIRYADDFLVLFQKQGQADHWLILIKQSAESLHLGLNQQKQAMIDLTYPFEFLGFRFERVQTAWVKTLDTAAQYASMPLDHLGWHDAKEKQASRTPTPPIILPGEMEHQPNWRSGATDRVIILGPGIERITTRQDTFEALGVSNSRQGVFKAQEVDVIVLIGGADWSAEALSLAADRDIEILLVDNHGDVAMHMLPQDRPVDAATLIAHCQVATETNRALIISRALVAAKLANYAALARALGDEVLSDKLIEDVHAAVACNDISSLRGIEGAGARRWYQALPLFVHNKFRKLFSRRVAPHGDDPVNVMLNIAQTALYRRCVLALRTAGLNEMVGLFHQPRSGHAALASDMQEPFRHLMDRVVIQATFLLHPDDFTESKNDRYPLKLSRRAIRTLMHLVYTHLSRWCRIGTSDGNYDPVPYQHALCSQARQLRQWIMGQRELFLPFIHQPDLLLLSPPESTPRRYSGENTSGGGVPLPPAIPPARVRGKPSADSASDSAKNP